MEQAQDILRELDTEELADRITDLQDEVREYREETGADSPEDAALQDVEVGQETFRAWQTTRRNLDIAKAALAIRQAKDAIEPSTVN